MNKNNDSVTIIMQSASRLSVCCTATGELLAPSYIRDRGPNSTRGPVWVNPPQNVIIASEIEGKPVVGIMRDGRVRKLPETEAYKVWVRLRARYDTDKVFTLFSRVPVSRAEKKMKRVARDFPGKDMGSYVRVVRTILDLPEAGAGVERLTSANWLVAVVSHDGVAAYSIAMPVGGRRHEIG